MTEAEIIDLLLEPTVIINITIVPKKESFWSKIISEFND